MSQPLSVRVVALSGCVPDTSRKPPCVLFESGLKLPDCDKVLIVQESISKRKEAPTARIISY
jgi:hypothetical protein